MSEPIEQSLHDEITIRVERLTSAIWPKEGKAESDQVGFALSDLLEFVLSRATGMASQTVIKFDGRLGDLEHATRHALERLESIKNQVSANSTRLNELNRRLNGKAELIDEQADKIEQQEVRIDNLERMVGERPSEAGGG